MREDRGGRRKEVSVIAAALSYTKGNRSLDDSVIRWSISIVHVHGH